MTNKTIFALSTAQGKAGIAIVRLSGSKAFQTAKQLCGSLPAPRLAMVRNLVYNGDLIDKAIVICFCAENSYSGEDMVEFQVHGSNAVLKNLSEILSIEFNLSVAEPGEFTRRALETGRIDLSQAEGILDLIESETKEQQKQSLRCINGQLADKTKDLKNLVIKGLSLVEIMIDFTDQDVPTDTIIDVISIVEKIISLLEEELKRYSSSELIRTGFDITIIGKPNVGKSSLLNYLAGREKAIVSSIAGTTRDIIELAIDLKGYRVNFFDTAGIHETKDSIERVGIDKAMNKAKDSFIRIFLLENSDTVDQFKINVEPDDLIFNAKSDLNFKSIYPGISGKTGEGVDNMLGMLSEKIKFKTVNSSILTNERHRKAIQVSVTLLYDVREELSKNHIEVEIVAEYLRAVIAQFDLLIGKVNVEDVLASIFSSFCIGK